MEKFENQTREVLRYLKETGSITSWEAIMHFGATRLSSIIYNLRKSGYRITTKSVTSKNRYDRPVTFAKYILEEEKND